MITFLRYLINKGWKIYTVEDGLCGKNTLIQDPESFTFSSLDVLTLVAIKNKHCIYYGLHQRHHPPTLIYPRPVGCVLDQQMDRYFETHTFNQLYKEIMDIFEEQDDINKQIGITDNDDTVDLGSN